jgi:hypothetical protein
MASGQTNPPQGDEIVSDQTATAPTETPITATAQTFTARQN